MPKNTATEPAAVPFDPVTEKSMDHRVLTLELKLELLTRAVDDLRAAFVQTIGKESFDRTMKQLIQKGGSS